MCIAKYLIFWYQCAKLERRKIQPVRWGLLRTSLLGALAPGDRQRSFLRPYL